MQYVQRVGSKLFDANEGRKVLCVNCCREAVYVVCCVSAMFDDETSYKLMFSLL